MRLGDLPPSEELAIYADRRAELGWTSARARPCWSTRRVPDPARAFRRLPALGPGDQGEHRGQRRVLPRHAQTRYNLEAPGACEPRRLGHATSR